MGNSQKSENVKGSPLNALRSAWGFSPPKPTPGIGEEGMSSPQALVRYIPPFSAGMRTVEVINEVIKDSKQAAAYLEDVIVFDSDPVAHVRTILSLFERLRKPNLKLSLLKGRLGATDANVLVHSVSPAGVFQYAEKMSALTNMHMPTDVKQVPTLMSGVNFHPIIVLDLSKRLRLINGLFRKGVTFAFTPAIEKLVLVILADPTTKCCKA